MKTKFIFFRDLFVCILLLSVGKLSAQCNTNFQIWSTLSAPGTALVNQPTNVQTDGMYVWNWGDGSSFDTTYYGNVASPSITHNYAIPMVYTVCVNYVSVSGSCNVSGCQTFSFQCNSSFQMWSNPNVPATAFVDQPYNGVPDALYIWNWGDGSVNDTTYYNTGSTPSITHNYSTVGVYSVCVNYVSASAGCNVSSCQTFSVNSTTLPPKFIGFQSAGDSTWYGVCPQMPVVANFYLLALADGYTPSDSISAKVYFGDGTDTTFKLSPTYSQWGGGGYLQSNFNHTYINGGLYSVLFTLKDNAGLVGDTLTKYNELDLQDSCGNLCGHAYVDINGNCQYDSGDSIMSNVWLEIHSSTGNVYYSWTDAGGYYSIQVPAANTYTIAAPNMNSFGYNYVCGGAGLGGISIPSVVNVGFSCPSGFDLTGFMNSTGFVPGQPAYLRLYPQNLSCLIQAGTATLTLDPNTTFVAEISGGSYAILGNQFSWAFGGLTSLNSSWWWTSGSNDRYLQLNASASLQIGDSVCFILDVLPTSGDINVLNNTIRKCFEVRSSYDPNFKEVYPRGVGAQGYVTQNSEFTYTIHFQNTGNAPAYNIAILDTIDSDLDLSTFHIIGASHYVVPNMAGTDIVKFNFNNIMLPDSASDPLGSQGWVTYKVKAKPNQVAGTQYTNTAYIYFDFNPAIITNTTLNTIGTVGVNEIKNNISKISVAPNPVGDMTQLTLQSAESGKITIQVVDMLGRVISSEEYMVNNGKNVFNLDTQNLPEGMYLINLVNDGPIIGSVKIIK